MRTALLAAAIAAVLALGHAGAGAAQPAAAPRAGAAAPFEGRYRHGPDVSPVRVVMFTDYQCPECGALDGVLEPILAEHPEYAISVKHFPFSNACNPNLPQGQAGNMHPNACWAARAAEAAGILRGRDGFWAMHRWLFSRRGSFTDAELRAALRGMGYDTAEFERTMTGPETLARVQADIAEGMDLGIFSTPMLFVNGREVKNTRDAGAVKAAIDGAAAAGVLGSAAEDRPPTATEKIVEDWRAQPVVRFASEPRRWLGAKDDARVSVVIWGDLLEPNSVRADSEMQRILAARRGVRYAFRHFPTDQTCNDAMPRTIHKGACVAAEMVEAAFLSRGERGGWHVFGMVTAMTQEDKNSLAAEPTPERLFVLLKAHDRDLGGTLQTTVTDAEFRRSAAERVASDVAGAKLAGVTSVPLIFVNGKRVPRWVLGDRPVLDLIVDTAARAE